MIHFEARYVFVHVPKTAGTSIKRLLVGYDPTKAWQPDPAVVRHLYAHRTAAALHAELEASVGPEEAARFHRFAFVRNPFDRVLSAWRYLREGGGGGLQAMRFVAAVHPYGDDFGRFVREGLPALARELPYFLPQHHWTHDGVPPAGQLHFVGRYERLRNDLGAVLRQLGLPPLSPADARADADADDIPHLRRSAHASYASYYDAATRACVAEVYARDLELFDYAFGG